MERHEWQKQKSHVSCLSDVALITILRRHSLFLWLFFTSWRWRGPLQHRAIMTLPAELLCEIILMLRQEELGKGGEDTHAAVCKDWDAGASLWRVLSLRSWVQGHLILAERWGLKTKLAENIFFYPLPHLVHHHVRASPVTSSAPSLDVEQRMEEWKLVLPSSALTSCPASPLTSSAPSLDVEQRIPKKSRIWQCYEYQLRTRSAPAAPPA